MIREISKILSQFKNCFSRTAPFNWFAIIIMGFFVRLDHHGVSSMVRWLNLEPSKYTSLLLFFRTSSWNLKKIQAGQSINAPGMPEIPQIVFEELLVNALIHRDYFISAVIRIFIFEDRIEIISPGHLPNNLTIEKITAGNSNIRNPILASFVAKKLLPYRGLGSGIRRSLEEWPDIDFIDDRDGCTFKVIVHRNPRLDEPLKKAEQPEYVDLKVHLTRKHEPLTDLQVHILELIRTDPKVSYEALTEELNKGRSTIMRNIQKLKDAGLLFRVGSKKSGYWKIMT